MSDENLVSPPLVHKAKVTVRIHDVAFGGDGVGRMSASSGWKHEPASEAVAAAVSSVPASAAGAVVTTSPASNQAVASASISPGVSEAVAAGTTLPSRAARLRIRGLRVWQRVLLQASTLERLPATARRVLYASVLPGSCAQRHGSGAGVAATPVTAPLV